PSQPLPKMSAIKPQKHSCHNLTLSDWLAIVAYHGKHQPIPQEAVDKHFANKEDGTLIFNQ
ncbi:hypothetical protein PAXRUDRAFT_174649, partial [Paxillus rubicundulus Ve08.2h10]